MNILIDIGHPAHVHLYKNLAKDLNKKGHRTFITVKDLVTAKLLLRENNLEYIELPAKSDSLWGKIIRQLQFDWIIFKLVKKYKIQIGIGTSVTIAHVSRLTQMKSILFDDDDDEVQPLVVKWLHPYADTIVSPASLLFNSHPRKANQTLYYEGFHELAYLHPARFTPNPIVLHEFGLKPGDPYFILRFNVFKAHHDIGEMGLSLKQKLEVIEILKGKGKIFITTERTIEPELEMYKAPVSNSKMHHLLYYAWLFIGDSQTMTSEAAVLGTPSLRCNSFAHRISYLEEEQLKYELTFGYPIHEFDNFKEKIIQLLTIPDLKEIWGKRRNRMLQDKINVTEFMGWFIENYPESVNVMKENPDYQYRFK